MERKERVFADPEVRGTPWRIYVLFPWLPCLHFWNKNKTYKDWHCERCGELRPLSFRPNPYRAWSGT
jgi:hypothetical protein